MNTETYCSSFGSAEGSRVQWSCVQVSQTGQLRLFFNPTIYRAKFFFFFFFFSQGLAEVVALTQTDVFFKYLCNRTIHLLVDCGENKNHQLVPK